MADNDVQCRSHQWLPETENTCESICFSLEMPETSCRLLRAVMKHPEVSLICSVSCDGPYSSLISSDWSCAITRHVCGACCPDLSVWTGSRCRAGMSAPREGAAYKQGVSHQRDCNSTNSHEQLQKQTAAIATAALKATLWKENRRLLHTLWKLTRNSGKVISPQRRCYYAQALYCIVSFCFKQYSGCRFVKYKTELVVAWWKRNQRTKTATKLQRQFPLEYIQQLHMQLTYGAEEALNWQTSRRDEAGLRGSKKPPTSLNPLLPAVVLLHVKKMHHTKKAVPTSTCPGGRTWEHRKYVLLQC